MLSKKKVIKIIDKLSKMSHNVLMRIFGVSFVIKRQPSPIVELKDRVDSLVQELNYLTEKLTLVAKQTEATRKKVYRDGDGEGERAKEAPEWPEGKGHPAVYRTGDPAY